MDEAERRNHHVKWIPREFDVDENALAEIAGMVPESAQTADEKLVHSGPCGEIQWARTGEKLGYCCKIKDCMLD